MTARWLRLLLVLQVAFFAAWGAYLLTSHRGGELAWLETEPIDPRDYISGQYVDLRFSISVPENVSGCSRPDAPGGRLPDYPVCVKLVAEKTVTLRDGRLIQVARGDQCMPLSAITKGDTWVCGRWARSSWRRPELQFGIGRYYVSESSPLRYARSGEVVAAISVNRNHQARIKELAFVGPRSRSH